MKIMKITLIIICWCLHQLYKQNDSPDLCLRLVRHCLRELILDNFILSLDLIWHAFAHLNMAVTHFLYLESFSIFGCRLSSYASGFSLSPLCFHTSAYGRSRSLLLMSLLYIAVSRLKASHDLCLGVSNLGSISQTMMKGSSNCSCKDFT